MSDSSPSDLPILTATQLAVAGAFGGIAEALAVQPLDMVKTRFQLNTIGHNPSIYTALSTIYHQDGFLRFYRGVLPEISGMIPKSAMMYMSNEVAKRELVERNGGVLDAKVAFIAGGFSGLPEALSVAPFQVAKVRLQSKEYLGIYKNTFDCVGQIIRSEGPRAFFIGFGPTLWRNVLPSYIWSVPMITCLRVQTPSSKAVDLFQTLIAGSVAGLIATGFNAPFDNVKSRFQSERVQEGVPRFHQYTLKTLFHIFQTEGIRGVYKGGAAKSIRMCVGGGVAMAAFELTCYVMKRMQAERRGLIGEE